MAKNNRRNAVEVVTNLNTEVVEMTKEYCTECGKELLGKVIVRGAGVCMECVNEMIEEVKLYEENSMEVVELSNFPRETGYERDSKECEECLISKECKRSRFDNTNQYGVCSYLVVEEDKRDVVSMNNVVRCEEDMRLDAEFNKEYELLLAKETKLNAYIKNAIKHGRDNKVKGAMACITKGQLIAIARNYEVIVGRRMSEAQYNHLKTLDGSQAHFVEMAIRQVQGKIRQHDFDKRIAESRAKKALANA